MTDASAIYKNKFNKLRLNTYLVKNQHIETAGLWTVTWQQYTFSHLRLENFLKNPSPADMSL